MEHSTNFNAADLASQAREDVRDSLFLAAIVRKSGGEERNVRVRNLSAGGMMAECDAGFAQGDEICVTLRGIGVISGKIAWVKSGRIGVAFDREIDPKDARKPVGQGGTTPAYAKPALTRRPGLRSD